MSQYLQKHCTSNSSLFRQLLLVNLQQFYLNRNILRASSSFQLKVKPSLEELEHLRSTRRSTGWSCSWMKPGPHTAGSSLSLPGSSTPRAPSWGTASRKCSPTTRPVSWPRRPSRRCRRWCCCTSARSACTTPLVRWSLWQSRTSWPTRIGWTPLGRRRSTMPPARTRSAPAVKKQVAIILRRTLPIPDCYRLVGNHLGAGKSTVQAPVMHVCRAINCLLLCRTVTLGNVQNTVDGSAAQGFSNCREVTDGRHMFCPQPIVPQVTATERAIFFGYVSAGESLGLLH
ncbi:uncharacterized protein LOC119854502 isoform X2 [Dermochelys coriacea]|uniref:uncharacterized protein LOC119854502 isoform X2 n=1 Tax=Dermochelys coriacea TaxID=27794 RepID=UPI001CA8F850|nr:uncharacterized protein LOC119854502 isoform X2 [Dermochelys coriacea]